MKTMPVLERWPLLSCTYSVCLYFTVVGRNRKLLHYEQHYNTLSVSLAGTGL
jgi:hypothetical protein